MKKNCAVIGSGIAGLAAAIRLAAKGHTVDVYEINNYPGGKIKEQYAKGYRFDMGPSVFMLPALVDELFELCGKNPRDYFTYTPIETSFKYFFEDGSVINAYADIELFAKEIELKTNHSKEVFYAYLKNIETKYNITKDVFIENSLHVFGNFFTKETAYGIANFGKIDSFKTMNEANNAFFKDPRLVQLFNNYATYIGSNPFTAPATLNMIQHLEINTGTYLPNKGIYAIVTSLVKLAEEMGIKFIYNTRVDEIVIQNKQVTGIKIKNDTIEYDRVVSNMDIYYTYKKLLPAEKFSKRIIEQPKSTSLICFYWGINKKHTELEIHNMLFAVNEKEEYEAVFERKTISEDPSIYIFITSKSIKEDAPADCENWFVLVTAPNDTGQDWDVIFKKTRQNVIKKINRMLKTEIEKYIDFEDSLTPVKIKNNYSSAFGAVYGNSSNSKFAAFLRHPNFSKKIKGLYFVGGTVHPGAGIPMCLNSAKIMDKVFS
jgi:phytoene desaturase